MNGKERITNILKHKKTDRIGLFEHFWGDTHKAWIEQGKIKSGDDFVSLFNYDLMMSGWFNFTADLDFKPVVIEETEDTVVTLDGNGAVMRRHKKHDTTPEHIRFTITESSQYYDKIRPQILKFDPRRIGYEAYRDNRKLAAQREKFFFWNGVNVFECMHPVIGHENMLAGMALEPEWISDMAMDYARMIVEMQQELFAQEGVPDGIFYYEDMGFKERPFMSPAMYKELIQPAHKYTIDYAKSISIPVIMHSCGFVEPLLPGMIEAGIDGLQVIEVKAGMDLLRIYKNYGEKLALMGGIDVRVLYSNDFAKIDAELEAKIPTVMQGGAYILHSDHSIPCTVNYETYCYFVEKGLKLGTYK